MKEIKITKEFEELFDLIENKNRNVVLFGSAGTGKSTFLKWFKQNTKKNVICLAPTGIAALNIEGVTIHSMFNFPFKPLTPHDIGPLSKSKKNILNKADVIIIDEISMLKPDILDAISWSLQINLGKKKIFGGKQIILTGDIFQLPPVINNDVKFFYDKIYDSQYFFSSKTFLSSNFKIYNFNYIFRQKDKEFINHLNNIRLMNKNKETIEYFNKRNIKCEDKNILTITSFVKTADFINEQKLKMIDSKQKVYSANIKGDFKLANKMITPIDLILKVGAKVMFTKNDDEDRYKNGTFGIIKYLGNNYITVEIENEGIKEKINITRSKWVAIDYYWNDEENKFDEIEKGSFEQFPLTLGYAITIHKSQGQTYESAKIDLGSGAFVSGQLYTALSRCINYNNLYLVQKIKDSDIIYNSIIINWWKNNVKK